MSLRIHVADPTRAAGSNVVSFDEVHTTPGLDDVLFVGVARREDLRELPDRIYSTTASRTRRLTRHFLLRAHPDEARLLTTVGSPIISAFKERFNDVDVTVLHDAQSHRLTHIVGDQAIPEELKEPIIAAARSAELSTLADQPGVVLPTSDSYHYVGPNGSHYRAFLRVGLAFQSLDTLDAAAFWIAPHLGRDTIVVVDSPSLIGLGHALAYYARDATSHRVYAVDSLASMDDFGRDALTMRLRRLASDTDVSLTVLNLSSVLSSGRSLKHMAAAASAAGLSTREVVMFRSGATMSNRALATAPAEVAAMSPCELCDPSSRRRSAPLPINATSMHVEVNGAVTQQRLRRSDAAVARDFLGRYAGLGAISVHSTERDGHGRHHAVDIDVRPLLAEESFLVRLEARLATIGPGIEIILSPRHDGAQALADLVAARLNVPVIVADEDQLSELSNDDRDLVLAAEQLLIVDDVVISGDRLRGYRQFLFELGRESGTVHALVGVSRPSTRDEAETIRNLTDQMSIATETTFHPVEEVLLPNWGAEECPWCLERDLIGSYRGSPPDFELSEALLARHALLTSTNGLIDEAFWSADGTPFVLGDGSIFAPASATHAELFFAVASAIQNLRSEGDLEEEARPPLSKLLKREFWVHGRFYASAITAAILRGARTHDLVPPQPSAALKKSLTQRLLEPAGHVLRWELLLAIAFGKLPSVPAATDVLDEQIDDEVVRRFFLDHVREDRVR